MLVTRKNSKSNKFLVLDIKAKKLGKIFKRDGASKLSPSYLPSELPHREQHINELLKIFSPLLEREKQIPWAVMIQGPSGTGKTSVVRAFFRTINNIANKKGIKIITDIINCRFVASDFSLAQAIALRAMPNASLRGFSATEMIQNVMEYLRNNESYLILALDDFDSYVARKKLKSKLVYDILKQQEITDSRIFIIFIGVNDYTLMFEESWVRNYVWRTKSRFEPYSWNELKDVLGKRAEEVFEEGVIGESELTLASRISSKFGYGSARYGLELLLISGMEAEWEGSNKINSEHLRLSLARLEGKQEVTEFSNFSRDLRKFTLALADIFEEEDTPYLSLESLLGQLKKEKQETIEYLNRLNFEGIADLLELNGSIYIGLFLPLSFISSIKQEDDVLI